MKSCRSVFVRLLVCVFALALASCSSTSVRNSPPKEVTNKVLFVGNSLTYVGNLPAVFDALCQANGQSCQSDMVVQGGATLSDHWSAKTARSLIESKAFDAVVLQERGGDAIGMAFGSKQTPEVIKNASSSATQKLTDLIKIQQQNAFYLGT